MLTWPSPSAVLGTVRVRPGNVGACVAEGATAARVNGRLRRINNPVAAIRSGIGFVPPSRRLGLIMNQSVHDNILLPSLGTTLGGFGRTGIGRVIKGRLETTAASGLPAASPSVSASA